MRDWIEPLLAFSEKSWVRWLVLMAYIAIIPGVVAHTVNNRYREWDLEREVITELPPRGQTEAEEILFLSSYVMEFSKTVDGIPIEINAGHQHLTGQQRAGATELADLDHICISASYSEQSIAMAYPRKERAKWATLVGQHLPLVLSPGQESVVRSSPLNQQDEQYARAFLRQLYFEGNPFSDHVQEWSKWNLRLDLIDTVIHILAFIMALIVGFQCLVEQSLKSSFGEIARRALEKAGLKDDDEAFAELRKVYYKSWKKGRSTTGLEIRFEEHIRKIMRRRRAAERKERSRKIRESLQSETQAKVLERQIRSRARVIRREADPLDTPALDEKLEQAREELGEAIRHDSHIGELVDLYQLVAQELDDRVTDSDVDEVQEEQEEREDEWIKVIRSCNHSFRNLEVMPAADLERMSSQIRRIKKKMRGRGRPWNAFVNQFDGSKPSTYRKALEMATSGRYMQLRESLSESQIGRLMQSDELVAFTEYPDLPETLDELPAWVQTHCADGLILHSNAERTLKRSPYEDPQLIGKCLFILATEGVSLRRTSAEDYPGARRRFEEAMSSLSVECSKSAKQSTLKRFAEVYSVTWPERSKTRRVLRWHLKQGAEHDETRTLRIYYFFCEEEGKIVVGHLPGHLRNAHT